VRKWPLGCRCLQLGTGCGVTPGRGKSEGQAPTPTARACAGGAPALAGFQEAILRRLLLADAGRDLVDLAADALLPLLVAHPADFQALGARARPPLGRAPPKVQGLGASWCVRQCTPSLLPGAGRASALPWWRFEVD